MSGKNVIVYVSSDCPDCDKIRGHLDKWNIEYEERNVTENNTYMKELQQNGVFGTPATFVNDKVVLGLQLNKIKYVLGFEEGYLSYFSSFYDRYHNKA